MNLLCITVFTKRKNKEKKNSALKALEVSKINENQNVISISEEEALRTNDNFNDYHNDYLPSLNERNGATAKDVALPNCNLWLKGFGYDRNGNKIVTVTFPNGKGFSIQTNGNLPLLHSLITSYGFNKREVLDNGDLHTIAHTIISYIQNYGSARQKSQLKVY